MFDGADPILWKIRRTLEPIARVLVVSRARQTIAPLKSDNAPAAKALLRSNSALKRSAERAFVKLGAVDNDAATRVIDEIWNGAASFADDHQMYIDPTTDPRWNLQETTSLGASAFEPRPPSVVESSSDYLEPDVDNEGIYADELSDGDRLRVARIRMGQLYRFADAMESHITTPVIIEGMIALRGLLGQFQALVLVPAEGAYTNSRKNAAARAIEWEALTIAEELMPAAFVDRAAEAQLGADFRAMAEALYDAISQDLGSNSASIE